MTIRTLLIANRGEIACRVMRTCKKLNIKTIALFSDVDRESKHTRMADEAYALGGNLAAETYLNIEKILNIARLSGAGAIHPGYGFLSENARFAKAVEDAGLIFVGPNSKTILSMGNKEKAKALMKKAGVPVVPGFNASADVESMRQQALSIGLPVIIKAAAGGGGKGMRIVHQDSELLTSIEAAKREALSSFGDDELIVEKYLSKARHIEVQIFGDSHGNTVHLFERDCSIQRRHQKIIEEAPALGIRTEVKQKIWNAALLAAQSIQYQNAGTVEFLYDEDETFYFLEMNTRLQVEHPITECITGVDLVEWQLHVANGLPLPLKQDAIQSSGHAIEARLYAEDPFNHFLPATGVIQDIFLPDALDFRFESGIQKGDKVGIFYDPILAKVVVSGPDRQSAIHTLSTVLNQMELVGLTNNIGFLRSILRERTFRAASPNTHYLNEHMESLLLELRKHPHQWLAPAALGKLLHDKQVANLKARLGDEPNSPWNQINGWQLNSSFSHTIKLSHHHQIIELTIQHLKDNGYFITGNALQHPVHIQGQLNGTQLDFEINGVQQSACFHVYDGCMHLFMRGHSEVYHDVQELHESSVHTHKGSLLAPMPGVITKIWVEAGMTIFKGDKLLAMEAMKMEHTLSAQQDGLVKSIYYKVGDQVDQGTELFEFEAND